LKIKKRRQIPGRLEGFWKAQDFHTSSYERYGSGSFGSLGDEDGEGSIFCRKYDGKKEERVLVKISGGRMRGFILLKKCR
jgi:hypothetical protein